ncbi:MAG: hypothetical protein HRU03_02840 [Nanoarchaeales archaeon]|nr:hypothetical protein [Nanoarchaeales archaeon]
MKIVDWNINGGYLVKEHSTENNLNFFINKIKELNPDIVLIQEGHISKTYNQIKVLSEKLDLKYYKYQTLGESHIEKGNQLCLFVLSKFEITSSEFLKLSSPDIISYNEKYGGEIKSDKHEKGFLKVTIKKQNKVYTLVSGHGHALHIFNKSLDDFPKLISEMRKQITELSKEENLIFGADLNYDKVCEKFENIFSTNPIKLVFKNVNTYKNAQADYLIISDKFKIIDKKLDMCTHDHALSNVEIDEK